MTPFLAKSKRRCQNILKQYQNLENCSQPTEYAGKLKAKKRQWCGREFSHNSEKSMTYKKVRA